MRLNRFLAQAGCGSRRACETLIRESRVTINGAVVTDLATQVAPGDHVKVGNRLLRNAPTLTAILHKPRGIMCTADDPEGRKTIYELLPSNWPRVFSVGRLDYDSEGLLLVTNDGDLAQRLTHPRHKLPKSYEVTLDRDYDPLLAPKLLKGIILEGKKARFEAIHKIGPAKVKVVLTQGLKRQIRLMFLAFGYSVRRLVRTEIGKLHLGRLPVGQWEVLSAEDVRRCFGDGTGPIPGSGSATPASALAPTAERERPARPSRPVPAGHDRPRRRTGTRTPSAATRQRANTGPGSASGKRFSSSKPSAKPFKSSKASSAGKRGADRHERNGSARGPQRGNPRRSR